MRELSPLPRSKKPPLDPVSWHSFWNRTTYRTCGFWIAWTSSEDFCSCFVFYPVTRASPSIFPSGFVLFDLQHFTTATASIYLSTNSEFQLRATPTTDADHATILYCKLDRYICLHIFCTALAPVSFVSTFALALPIDYDSPRLPPRPSSFHDFDAGLPPNELRLEKWQRPLSWLSPKA